MNEHQTAKDDARTHDLLHSWRIDASLPPGFEQQVWRRISLADSRQGTGVREWLAGLSAVITSVLQRPLGAAAYLSILLVAGAMLGYWSSEHRVQQTEAAWRSAYVQAVMPTASFHPSL